ncbi:LacI family transcriptional regulator, partial [Burkholderia cenocepacia]|nr:LacI family transcriptional regulator [Burkholderia cenocepacia]MDR5670720.1 LacI family transcriptional regulator [Burkholderia cenocepacia]
MRGMTVKVNLKALSDALGLSRTTVSRALNGYDDVSEATRERVAKAAREMGYVADPTARRLATGRADMIGIVYPFGAGDLGDPRFGEVVAGLTERL